MYIQVHNYVKSDDKKIKIKNKIKNNPNRLNVPLHRQPWIIGCIHRDLLRYVSIEYTGCIQK